MGKSHYYPDLNGKNLKLVYKLYTENPDYFDNEDCPYEDDVKKIFIEALAKPEVNDFDDFDIDSLQDENHILREIATLYKHLQDFGSSMRESDTASEKNTYFKLSTTLLEKLIGMRERTVNIQRMNEFTATVLTIMQEELDTDERSRIMDRLKGVLDS